MADAILLLAGGSATRFPGKLEHDIEGQPMIVRVFAKLARGPWPVYVAGKGSFAPPVDAALCAPLLIDRWSPRGPLYALLSACPFIPADRIFAVAADQPQLEPSVLERLLLRGCRATKPRCPSMRASSNRSLLSTTDSRFSAKAFDCAAQAVRQCAI